MPKDCSKADITPIFKKSKKEDSGNYRPVSLALIPGKVMEHLILETISRHTKEKKVIWSSKRGFTDRQVMLDQLDKLL